MPSNPAQTVINAILSGRTDERLSEVGDAVRLRIELLGRQQRADLEVGDIVVMNGKGTRYLKGVRCRVERKLRKNVVLRIIDDGVFFRGEKLLRCSPNLFTKEEQVSDAAIEPIEGDS